MSRNKFFNHWMRLALTLLVANSLLAQKTEVEKRIPEKEFPKAAIDWLAENFEGATAMRYFREYSDDTTNYEAKFRWQKSKYSVEFLKDGSLKDIEKTVPFSTIPAPGKTVMLQKMGEDFRRFKISRCQEQTRPHYPGKRYEIEIKGKRNSQNAMYEYLFEEDGRLILSRQIVLPTNNITLY